ncbi:MAG: sigma-70 family RNA polymerase sigma factor [Verrucomicrobiota bacterium]
MKTDAELLREFAREGANAAYTELVQRHIGMVYGAALRHVGGDAHLAEDVTQTVFAALARKAEGVAQRGALAGWLYLSAHHAAAQVVRTERRRRTREEAHAMHERLINDETAAEWERVRPVLDEAMRELGEAEREAVLLRFFEQRPFAQIGAALNVSEDAARMRVERALEKLRALLGRRGIASAGAALGAALAGHASVTAPAALLGSVTGAGAVASASVAATAVGAGLFMKTTLMAVSAAAVVAVGAALYQNDRAQRATAEAAAMAKQRDAALAEARAAEQRSKEQMAVAQRERMAVASSEAAVTAQKAAAPPVVGTLELRAADGSQVGRSLNIEQTPEGRAAAIRDAVAKTHAAFFPKMGWSEQQQERFKTLWVERKEREHQLAQDARAKGETLDRDVVKRFFHQAEGEFNAKVQAEFGPAAVAGMEDFKAKGMFRAVVNDVTQRLFNSPNPLTSAQAERLIDVMADNARTPAGKFDFKAMDTAAVAVQAQTLLSPAQSAMVREVYDAYQREVELAERGREQRAAVQPGK